MSVWKDHYATRMARVKTSEIREMLKIIADPKVVSFAGGIPDPELFPKKEIAEIYQHIFADKKLSSEALQYAISEGYIPLRKWLAEEMAKQGVPCTMDNVMITQGSQQALDFVGKMLIDAGDTVLTEYPTYLGALQAFHSYECAYDVLPHLDKNRTPESYHDKKGKMPKFAYVVTEFANPTGKTLTLEERNHILDMAQTMDMPIFEDNAYEKLRYEGTALPSLLSLAVARAGGDIEKTKVVYCGTFSKSIAPGLRIGWIIGARDVIAKLVQIKQEADMQCSTINQIVAYQYAHKYLDSHAAELRPVYKARRDAMLNALGKYMPKGASWTKPEGGMFVWLTLPEGMDGERLLAQSMETIKIAFVPGAPFYPDRSGKNTIRLNFSLNTPEVIDDGIKKLAGLIVG